MLKVVDLNCDMGEGVPEEESLIPFFSSVNVSCGAHAGSPLEIRNICKLAKKHGVRVGAHPSFPDRAGFGRRIIPIPLVDLESSLTAQLANFKKIALSERVEPFHVKPHGALYHLICREEAWARMFLAVLDRALPDCPVMLAHWAETARFFEMKGVIREAFLDRGYRADGTLVPRSEPGALLNVGQMKARVKNLLEGKAETVDGHDIQVKAESFCLHADTPGALELIREVRRVLDAKGVRVARSG